MIPVGLDHGVACQTAQALPTVTIVGTVFHLQETMSMRREHATVPTVGWAKPVSNLVSMVRRRLILFASASHVTMALSATHYVLTGAVCVEMESATVDLKGGGENFAKGEDAQDWKKIALDTERVFLKHKRVFAILVGQVGVVKLQIVLVTQTATVEEVVSSMKLLVRLALIAK